MKLSADAIELSIFDNFTCYHDWKKKRSSIIDYLSQNFILLNENELSTQYSILQQNAEKLSVSNSKKEVLKCLMIISVLNYFKSDSTFLNSILSNILDCFQSSTDEITFASTKALYWIAQDSYNGFALFRTKTIREMITNYISKLSEIFPESDQSFSDSFASDPNSHTCKLILKFLVILSVLAILHQLILNILFYHIHGFFFDLQFLVI